MSQQLPHDPNQVSQLVGDHATPTPTTTTAPLQSTLPPTPLAPHPQLQPTLPLSTTLNHPQTTTTTTTTTIPSATSSQVLQSPQLPTTLSNQGTAPQPIVHLTRSQRHERDLQLQGQYSGFANDYQPLTHYGLLEQGEPEPDLTHVCFICKLPPKRPTDSYRIASPDVVQYCFALRELPTAANRLCARHYHLLRLHNQNRNKIFPFECARNVSDRKRTACTAVNSIVPVISTLADGTSVATVTIPANVKTWLTDGSYYDRPLEQVQTIDNTTWDAETQALVQHAMLTAMPLQLLPHLQPDNELCLKIPPFTIDEDTPHAPTKAPPKKKGRGGNHGKETAAQSAAAAAAAAAQALAAISTSTSTPTNATPMMSALQPSAAATAAARKVLPLGTGNQFYSSPVPLQPTKHKQPIGGFLDDVIAKRTRANLDPQPGLFPQSSLPQPQHSYLQQPTLSGQQTSSLLQQGGLLGQQTTTTTTTHPQHSQHPQQQPQSTQPTLPSSFQSPYTTYNPQATSTTTTTTTTTSAPPTTSALLSGLLGQQFPTGPTTAGLHQYPPSITTATSTTTPAASSYLSNGLIPSMNIANNLTTPNVLASLKPPVPPSTQPSHHTNPLSLTNPLTNPLTNSLLQLTGGHQTGTIPSLLGNQPLKPMQSSGLFSGALGGVLGNNPTTTQHSSHHSIHQPSLLGHLPTQQQHNLHNMVAGGMMQSPINQYGQPVPGMSQQQQQQQQVLQHSGIGGVHQTPGNGHSGTTNGLHPMIPSMVANSLITPNPNMILAMNMNASKLTPGPQGPPQQFHSITAGSTLPTPAQPLLQHHQPQQQQQQHQPQYLQQPQQPYMQQRPPTQMMMPQGGYYQHQPPQHIMLNNIPAVHTAGHGGLTPGTIPPHHHQPTLLSQQQQQPQHMQQHHGVPSQYPPIGGIPVHNNPGSQLTSPVGGLLTRPPLNGIPIAQQSTMAIQSPPPFPR